MSGENLLVWFLDLDLSVRSWRQLVLFCLCVRRKTGESACLLNDLSLFQVLLNIFLKFFGGRWNAFDPHRYFRHFNLGRRFLWRGGENRQNRLLLNHRLIKFISSPVFGNKWRLRDTHWLHLLIPRPKGTLISIVNFVLLWDLAAKVQL